MENKKRSVSKFVKIKRSNLSKLIKQLQDAMNQLENMHKEMGVT